MSHWTDELTAWWDDVRHWVAFAIAPLAVPVIVIASVGLNEASQGAIGLIVSFSLMLGYFGTVLFGLPIYLLLYVYGQTGFWLAPIAGFVAGLTMMYLVHSWLGIPLLSVAGPAGAIVGALLWLIARPDRPRRSV